MQKNILLSIRNLSKSFGRKKALDDVSFDIQKGKITGFLGPNGAGKTTTIKILLGLIKKDSGQIKVNGKQIKEVKNLIFRLPTGAVMEFPAFYPNLTARENLMALSMIDNNKIDEKRIDHLLNSVGLKSDKDSRVKTFSFGMNQKLAIADALLNDPDFLVLDEPFNGLDPNAMDNLNKILKDFIKNRGTVFLSSHILSEMENLCDWVILINKGKIALEEDLISLTSQKSLKDIYLKLTEDENI